MRRSDRERDKKFAYKVIDESAYGIMAISTGEDEPYCVPLSIVRVDDFLYFHCAFEGRKVDLLKKNPNVCVSFVSEANPKYIAEKNSYTTSFKSANITGAAEEVTDENEKIMALKALCEKLLPDDMAGFDEAAAESIKITMVWRISIITATGKERAC